MRNQNQASTYRKYSLHFAFLSDVRLSEGKQRKHWALQSDQYFSQLSE
uniref:Uncharacterized protein n=1 Tax=Anguilla anguilla TaxID=7936 RepID=A0A0E9W9G0_ANGAN